MPLFAPGEQEFEAESEIGIFLFGEEIAAAIGGAHDLAVLHDVAGTVAADEFPPVQCLAVEQGSEAGLVGGEPRREARRNRAIDLVHRSSLPLLVCPAIPTAGNGGAFMCCNATVRAKPPSAWTAPVALGENPLTWSMIEGFCFSACAAISCTCSGETWLACWV